MATPSILKMTLSINKLTSSSQVNIPLLLWLVSPSLLDSKMMFLIITSSLVSIENNFPYWEEFIQKYNLWTLVDYVHSWFCSYPVYEMGLDELKEWDELWVKEFMTENNIEIKERTVRDNLRK